MKKHMFITPIAGICLLITGCTIFGGKSNALTEAEQNDVQTKLWYDNAKILVQANDPDLRADSYIGITALDAIVDSVKDVLAQVPAWTVTHVEQKHFNSMYMESAKALNSGVDDVDLVVKGEAFKTVLMMDTFAQSVAHTKEAENLKIEIAKLQFQDPNDARIPELKQLKAANYLENDAIYEASEEKMYNYLHNEIYPFNVAIDDAARKEFFASPLRQKWDVRTTEIAAKIRGCLATSDDEEAAKVAMTRLSKEMGVAEVDWLQVVQLLGSDLVRLQEGLSQLTSALQQPDIIMLLTKARFGGEVAPGISGKEALASVKRFTYQLKVNIQLITWLLSELAV